MYFIGAIITLSGAALVAYFKGAPLSIFVNPAVFVAVVVTVIGVLAATSGFKTFTRGLNAALSPRYVIDDEERGRAASLYRLLSKSVIFATLTCAVIGVISMLSYIDDTDFMAAALSASLIAIVSGLMLPIAFFEPAVYVLKKPRETPVLVREYPKHLGDHLLELCSQNGLTIEEIQNATSIDLRHD